MRKLLLTIALCVLATLPSLAQHQEGNPFKRLGYKPSVYTFGDDKEFHDLDTVVEIGDVLFNTQTKEVVGFVEDMDSLIELKPELQSMSIDPHCEKYYSITPYAYCMNNPVRFIDPNGRDWIEDKAGKITWNDDAKSNKTTPEGYTYIGNNNALLTHIGMNSNFSEQSSKRIGQFAFDSGSGGGQITVRVRNNVRIEVDEEMNINNSTSTNSLGISYNGVNVIGTSVSSDTGADGEVLNGSMMEVTYGDNTYESNFKEVSSPYVIEEGTKVTTGKVKIPASKINSSNGLPQVKVEGNWWSSKPEGKTPVTIFGTGLIIPASYTHKWSK